MIPKMIKKIIAWMIILDIIPIACILVFVFDGRKHTFPNTIFESYVYGWIVNVGIAIFVYALLWCFKQIDVP